MSKNLLCLVNQTITGKHKLQTSAAHLMPEHRGANTRQQR
ncbi:hypothetical protein UUU_14970 [Klebsiella pneumoniae subsp. pneumoniae DSM 30104 = JCM 1662 = NBRC 14940]|nr:hypothetical protein UUU_14970 [Klebsiella pneumoniae subsp. pneumoniae DSM 30104 = JCM 1662 = NBRC 14940]